MEEKKSLYVVQLKEELQKLDSDDFSHARRLVNEEVKRVQSGNKYKTVAMVELHHDRPVSNAIKVCIPIKVYLKEEQLRKEGAKQAHLNEDLHVLVDCFTDTIDGYHHIANALGEIKNFMNPLEEAKRECINSSESLQEEKDDVSSEQASSDSMEGWLSVPNRPYYKKYGWRRQYVVISSQKMLFYNSEVEKQKAAPVQVLNIDKWFHVRSVTEHDVYRGHAEDIPRMFEVMYGTEGENEKYHAADHKVLTVPLYGTIEYKGHEFMKLYMLRIPIACYFCNKPIQHTSGVECRRCHIRAHRDHLDKNEEFIGYCKVQFDQNIQASVLLLLAESADNRKSWVQHLSKKIP